VLQAPCPGLENDLRSRRDRCTIDRSVRPRCAGRIGGAWLVWQGVREHRGWVWIGAGVIALGVYGFVATLQPDAHFGRILAAYGGVFVAGSLLWGMVLDGFRPDRWDTIGALLCLVGVAVIMYAPRAA
jgi:small multidrug resistance family-3 protein